MSPSASSPTRTWVRPTSHDESTTCSAPTPLRWNSWANTGPSPMTTEENSGLSSWWMPWAATCTMVARASADRSCSPVATRPVPWPWRAPHLLDVARLARGAREPRAGQGDDPLGAVRSRTGVGDGGRPPCPERRRRRDRHHPTADAGHQPPGERGQRARGDDDDPVGAGQHRREGLAQGGRGAQHRALDDLLEDRATGQAAGGEVGAQPGGRLDHLRAVGDPGQLRPARGDRHRPEPVAVDEQAEQAGAGLLQQRPQRGDRDRALRGVLLVRAGLLEVAAGHGPLGLPRGGLERRRAAGGRRRRTPRRAAGGRRPSGGPARCRVRRRVGAGAARPRATARWRRTPGPATRWRWPGRGARRAAGCVCSASSGSRVDGGVPRLLHGEPVRPAPQLAAHEVGAALGLVQLGQGQGALQAQRERRPRGAPRVGPGAGGPPRPGRRGRWPRRPAPRPRRRRRSPAPGPSARAERVVAVAPRVAPDEQLGLEPQQRGPHRPGLLRPAGEPALGPGREPSGVARARGAAGRGGPARGRPRRRRARCPPARAACSPSSRVSIAWSTRPASDSTRARSSDGRGREEVAADAPGPAP